jgi:hypothetical protein
VAIISGISGIPGSEVGIQRVNGMKTGLKQAAAA